MILHESLIFLRSLAQPGEQLYLVGGAVRDALLSRASHDLDIVSNINPQLIARKFAEKTHSAFYVMDKERDTCRVLLKNQDWGTIRVDFAALRGETITADLLDRDFTINAMAVDLLAPDLILDPYKGGRDLQQKWLRPVTKTSLKDDPLRIIRAVRYAVDLGLKIEPETRQQIESEVDGLADVSLERKRDELFKILDGRNISLALQLLYRFRIFEYIPLAVQQDHTGLVSQSRTLEDVIGWLTGLKSSSEQAAFYQVGLLMHYGRFSSRFKEHFLAKNSSGRSRKALMYLACLIDHDKMMVNQSYEGCLALSVDEKKYLGAFAEHRLLLTEIMKNETPFDDLKVFRYFKQTGSVGLDLAVVALTEYAGRIGSEFSTDQWTEVLQHCEELVATWFERPDLINPELPVNGNDLMHQFDLDQGPLIGRLLDGLREFKVYKGGLTREEAITWVDNQLPLLS